MTFPSPSSFILDFRVGIYSLLFTDGRARHFSTELVSLFLPQRLKMKKKNKRTRRYQEKKRFWEATKISVYSYVVCVAAQWIQTKGGGSWRIWWIDLVCLLFFFSWRVIEILERSWFPAKNTKNFKVYYAGWPGSKLRCSFLVIDERRALGI